MGRDSFALPTGNCVTWASPSPPFRCSTRSSTAKSTSRTYGRCASVYHQHRGQCVKRGILSWSGLQRARHPAHLIFAAGPGFVDWQVQRKGPPHGSARSSFPFAASQAKATPCSLARHRGGSEQDHVSGSHQLVRVQRHHPHPGSEECTTSAGERRGDGVAPERGRGAGTGRGQRACAKGTLRKRVHDAVAQRAARVLFPTSICIHGGLSSPGKDKKIALEYGR
mmetsp:Transcript_2481/g.8912  ORF Transcript_2481/g.8912 Transcript_2481/m.8912 type:complete len:224 (-) Transcript_2481:150-821(-)